MNAHPMKPLLLSVLMAAILGLAGPATLLAQTGDGGAPPPPKDTSAEEGPAHGGFLGPPPREPGDFPPDIVPGRGTGDGDGPAGVAEGGGTGDGDTEEVAGEDVEVEVRPRHRRQGAGGGGGGPGHRFGSWGKRYRRPDPPGGPEVLLKLFAKSHKSGSKAFKRLLKAYLNEGRFHDAERVLFHIIEYERGLQRALIVLRGGDTERALRILESTSFPMPPEDDEEEGPPSDYPGDDNGREVDEGSTGDGDASEESGEVNPGDPNEEEEDSSEAAEERSDAGDMTDEEADRLRREVRILKVRLSQLLPHLQNTKLPKNHRKRLLDEQGEIHARLHEIGLALKSAGR